MIKILFLLAYICLTSSSFLYAQEDSITYIKYTKDYQFAEGLFLTFQQFRYNQVIPKYQIISSYDYNELDFFEKILDTDFIELYDSYGIKKKIPITQIWGFSKKGALYINWNDDFYRIPIVGSIGYFVANKTTYDIKPDDSYYYRPNSIPSAPPMDKTVELRQYMIDFNTGEVYDYSIQNLKMMLMNDPQLYDEYTNLSRRKQKKMHYYYLRQYNIRNDLYFPVYEAN